MGEGTGGEGGVRREGREEGAGITKSFLLKITIDYCRNY